jgi:hypothetical protein
LGGGAWSVSLPTIDRFGPYRVVIYLDDHEPAHVHVIHSSGSAAVFDISNVRAPALRELRGDMKINEVRGALNLVRKSGAEYLESWQQIHGGQDE